jgi:thermitase
MKKNIFILTTTIVIFVLFVVFLRSSLVSSSESNEAKPSIKKYDPKSVNSEHVEGEIIVKLKKGVSSISEKKALISSIGGESFKNLDSSGHVRIRLRDGDTVEDALKRYAEDENVEYLEPNFIVRLAAVPPSDTYYGPCLWGLNNTAQTISEGAGVCPSGESAYGDNNPGFANRDINVESFWNDHTDCSSVVVGIIDTGVNYNHEDLDGNMWDGASPYTKHGWNFVSNTDETSDTNGHGTHVAGIIGAEGDNGIGVTGVCWSASLMALKAFEDQTGYVSDIISALAFAVEQGVDIVNMSLQTSNHSTALTETIASAESAGILIVVASGNGNGTGVPGDDGKDVDVTGEAIYPCSYTNSNILCVTALDQKYTLPDFANWGSTSVDVGAPGTNSYSTTHSFDNYIIMNGTSMATPYAAGLAALIMSYHRNAVGGFGMTGIHAKDVIMRSGRIVSSLSGKTTTGKAIDATNILDYIATPYGVTGTVQ